MQTGQREKGENIAWIGQIYFKDICFACSFVVTLRYFYIYINTLYDQNSPFLEKKKHSTKNQD